MASCAEAPDPKRPDNVILLVVDTLRADHLGSYGSTLALTPELDRFAEDAAVFLDTVAQGPNTINSAPCLLASVFMSEHGYTNFTLAISEDHRTLAEILAEAGYETFAVSTNPNVTARNGMAQGFETFVADTAWENTDAETVNRIFLDWLEERSTGKPSFAMLWYIDPHVPYEPPEALIAKLVAPELRHLVSRRTRMPGGDRNGQHGELSGEEKLVAKALYQGEVAYFDEQFGKLVEELKVRGLFDDSLIVFTSDHGESFWEHVGPHGRPIYGHGVSLYRAETSIPLLIRLPGARFAGSVSARVNSIDVVPTVTELVGLAPSSSARGTSLLPLVDGRGRDVVADSVSELLTDFRNSVDIRQRSVETEEGKLIVTYKYRSKVFSPPLVQLVDLMNHEEEVPAEEGLAAALKRRLLRRLRVWEAGLSPIPPQGAVADTRDVELRKRLEALGYVN